MSAEAAPSPKPYLSPYLAGVGVGLAVAGVLLAMRCQVAQHRLEPSIGRQRQAQVEGRHHTDNRVNNLSARRLSASICVFNASRSSNRRSSRRRCTNARRTVRPYKSPSNPST